jgi:hypothetical protein
MNVKLTNICPIFVSANVADTVKYYVEVLVHNPREKSHCSDLKKPAFRK